jgi:3-phosphoshikimate 1-carboxyvinyltransferase
MEYVSAPALGALRGTSKVPGDKSISHRAVLFSAMAEGASVVSGVLDSADVRSTVSAVQALGAGVSLDLAPDGSLRGTVTGWGPAGPQAPEAPIDCGNSGTTARLLLGVLAGWPIEARLVGDASLERRPMRRVTDPLEAMGAVFEYLGDGTLPLVSKGPAAAEQGSGKPSPALLSPIAYSSPVASAQVKTAVLLAGLRAQGRTSVAEPAPSRDHTERLLPAFGVPVAIDSAKHEAAVQGPSTPQAADISVPGDPSSAAFLVAAAVLVAGSEIRVPDVALNPTRTGFIRVLQRMGARVSVVGSFSRGREPVGGLVARSEAGLHGCVVRPWEIASLVDEIPVLALVATQARGLTRFEGVSELRVKESDRLAAIVAGIRSLGGVAWVDGDDLVVSGRVRLRGGDVDSLGDHRLAMTWALAGLISQHPVTVREFDAVEVSFPGFAERLDALRRA